jgi:hypothetical protein
MMAEYENGPLSLRRLAGCDATRHLKVFSNQENRFASLFQSLHAIVFRRSAGKQSWG